MNIDFLSLFLFVLVVALIEITGTTGTRWNEGSSRRNRLEGGER
jgi:hypothetical protein